MIKTTNKRRDATKTTTKKNIPANDEKSGQNKWDELLATPESDALLTLLVAQAQREEQAGNFDEEDW